MKYYASILALLASKVNAGDPLPIAGYLPGTNVEDHGAIDRDQAAMEAKIATKDAAGFALGKAIYEDGGNSKSVGTLTLDSPLLVAIAKGAVVSGSSMTGNVVTATAYAAYDVGATTIDVKYTPMTCLIGALDQAIADDPPGVIEDGCFSLTGNITTDGTTDIGYTMALDDNTAKRTLQGFSTAVESKMSAETHAIYFNNYYGAWDYADQIAQAAFDGTSTSMTNGNADFSGLTEVGREQIIKKGIAYMNVFLYTMHEYEAAIVKCEAFDSSVLYNRDAIHAWDEGVAFYTGNMEDVDGSGSGKLVYALADKRCANFGTCGADGDETSGTSQVNLDIIALANAGNADLLALDCDGAAEKMALIQSLMYIPLIQGSLKYAWKTEFASDEKGKAEGTAFAHAVLPMVHEIDPTAAETIYESLKADSTETSAADVKAAFESVYEGMGVTCEQVGGLLDDGGAYVPGMEPCITKCTDKGQGPKNAFEIAGMGLSINCGQLNGLDAAAKTFACASGGADACPVTCGGACACTDKETKKFKSNGAKVSCGDLSTDPDRKKMCKKPNAKKACPKTCKGWCFWDTPFSE